MDKLTTDKPSRQYIGFEPSGKPHIGILPILKSIKDNGKGKCILFVANWHAKINGKDIYPGFSRELARLAYSMGIDHEIRIAGDDYLSDIADLELKVAQNLTTNRVQKALTITGKEYKGSERNSILRYITLQITDPFALGVNHIVSGEDQRSCSVLSVEVAKKIGFEKPTFETHPLLLNTKGKKEGDAKMSKSKPDTCIFTSDDKDTVYEKIQKSSDVFVNQLITLMGYPVSSDWRYNRDLAFEILNQTILS
jgi:tyrosyl-tRNA synthetase